MVASSFIRSRADSAVRRLEARQFEAAGRPEQLGFNP